MNFNRPLILASHSPRRKFLLSEADFSFKVIPSQADESYPGELALAEVPMFLARKKAVALTDELREHVILAADTVVILDNAIMNKPQDRDDAIRMLHTLSGRTHQVITAVCILSNDASDSFSELSEVTFRQLASADITRYVDTCRPFDKAGAYGAQECLPPGMNPCSDEEMTFLRSIGKVDLIEKSMTSQSAAVLTAIAKIQGSYFNVMGLPIHKVYDRLLPFGK